MAMKMKWLSESSNRQPAKIMAAYRHGESWLSSAKLAIQSGIEIMALEKWHQAWRRGNGVWRNVI